jgi:hypothetical protein
MSSTTYIDNLAKGAWNCEVAQMVNKKTNA